MKTKTKQQSSDLCYDENMVHAPEMEDGFMFVQSNDVKLGSLGNCTHKSRKCTFLASLV